MLKLESFVRLAPDKADHVARLLWGMTSDGKAFPDIEERATVREVSEALFALGNDTEGIVCADTFAADGKRKAEDSAYIVNVTLRCHVRADSREGAEAIGAEIARDAAPMLADAWADAETFLDSVSEDSDHG